MIESNPQIVKLLDRLAKEMMTVDETVQELYRLSLSVWCPDYKSRLRTVSNDNRNVRS